MSTSLLYHAFGIHGYKYVSTQFEKGAVIFKIHQESHKLRCPVCGGRRVIRRGVQPRRLRAVPIGKSRFSSSSPCPVSGALSATW
jgi:DNA-directed RNA polymerase subunit RPC12/RpoP